MFVVKVKVLCNMEVVFFYRKMGVGRIRSICHAFDRPPRMCHAWVWLRGCVGAWLRSTYIYI